MSHIVLSEGKNDVCFARSLLNKAESTNNIEEFVVEEYLKEVNGNPLVPIESEKIRTFIARRDTGDALIKSEGNKSNLLKVFSTIVVDLAQFNINFVIVVDLDGNSLDGIIHRLNGHIGSNYKGSLEINLEATTDITSEVKMAECNVVGDNNLEDDFIIICFSDDLESTVGVNRENDREEVESAISEYANQEERLDMIIRTLE